MIEVELKDGHKLTGLFTGWSDTLVWSFLQGCMGRGWADNPDVPTGGIIVLGDFCFAAGEAGDFPEDLRGRELIVIPGDERWAFWLEKKKGNVITRYGIEKEYRFNLEHLEKLAAAVPEGFALALIDEPLYEQALKRDFSRDFCSQFDSAADFAARGLGVVALKDGEIVAGASSYTMYKEGIEIEVATSPEYRRRGLATACSARLILECLERNIVPNWDAANKWSVGLAEKLGYTFEKEYACYVITVS